MRKRSRFISSLTVLALLASAALYASAQGPAATTQRLPFSSLTLKISSTKEEFVQLEPIPIILHLRNETDQPIVGHSALNFSNNFVKLFLIGENGQTDEIKDLSPVKSNTAAAPKSFGPGESLESRQALAFHLDKTFPSPGAYHIQAVFYDAGWTSQVRSNVLTVHILKPEGSDLAASEYIKSLGASSYFLSGVGFASKDRARAALEDFVTRFGETAYGDYAAFSLGEIYFYDKEYQRAGQRFSKLAQRTNFVLADKVSKYLNEIKRADRSSEKKPL